MIIDAEFEEIPEKKGTEKDRLKFHDIALFAFGIGLTLFSKHLFSYLTYR